MNKNTEGLYKPIMDMRDEILVGMIIGIAVGIFLGALIITKLQHDLKVEAIQLNYAEYNSTTGVWQWKTNVIVNE